MKTKVQQTEPAKECDNLLHAIRLTDPYSKDQVRRCMDCGEDVVLSVQVYPRWLTDALAHVVENPHGLKVSLYGIGFAEDLRGKNWERLEPYYRLYNPRFQNGEDPEGSNTSDANGE